MRCMVASHVLHVAAAAEMTSPGTLGHDVSVVGAMVLLMLSAGVLGRCWTSDIHAFLRVY